MEFHEAANIFPLDEEHIGDLAKDIRQHGLLYPIETLDGKILDGRRRFIACERAGVKPSFKVVSPADPVEYVLSLNLQRRHLTTVQAATCAVKAEALQAKLKQAAKERQKQSKGRGQKGCDNCRNLNETGRSDDQLGERFGISGKSVERARNAMETGIPELIAAMEAGTISVNKAQYIATHGAELQKELLDAELCQEQKPQRRAKPKKEESHHEGNGQIKLKGVGVIRADEAINSLIRIPKDDPLRKRGFQKVMDWIKHNR